MSIEEKLSELEIKKILVVDDREENLDAAKQYFQTINLHVEYATNAKDAIDKMKAAYEKEEKYDFILSDLEMETKTAGLDVVKEALEQRSYVTIASGVNYDKSDTDQHGPNTTIRPTGTSIKGKKEKPEVWKFALEESLNYIQTYKESPEFKAIERYAHFIGILPENIIDMLKIKYE